MFFAIKVYQDGHPSIKAEMTHLKELSEDEPKVYSWILTDHAVVMGYYIADTDLTMRNILAVLAHILHEASFFGYDQQSLERERQKLDEALTESNEETSISWDELREKLGLPPGIPDPEAEKYEQKIRQAEWDYLVFSRSRELENLKALLR